VGLLDFLSRVVGVRPLWNEVLPSRTPPQAPAFDGRTAGLHALRDYVCALQMYRPGDTPGTVIPFGVARQNFYVDYPDNLQQQDFAAGVAMCLPTGRFRYDPQGLNAFLDESSFGCFGQGTALQVQGTYVEQFNLEYSCALVQQRRAFKSAVEVAFMPADGVAALRLCTRGYYDQTATFCLKDGALFDSPDEARGRRKVQLGVEMRVQVVRLVNVATLTPVVQVNVDYDSGTGLPVTTTVNNPDSP
jgi:hypothetical protein